MLSIMKTIIYFIPAIICLLLSGLLNAQVAIDPIKKAYKIGGSSEIFISYTTSEKTNSRHQVLDVSDKLDGITSIEQPFQTGFLERRKNVSVTGDFNGDGASDIITLNNIINNNYPNEGTIWIRRPVMGDDLKITGKNEITDLNIFEKDYTRIRMIAGNFDGDPQDEFAICYDKKNALVVILVLKLISNKYFERIAYFQENVSYYDKNFDIAAGDIDGDGIDEIVMVRNKALPTRKSDSNPTILMSKYELRYFKYDPNPSSFYELTQWKKDYNLENIIGDYYPDQGSTIPEMRIVCGDLNNDGKDEVAVGWTMYYCYSRSDTCITKVGSTCVAWAYKNKWTNTTFLNLFNPNGDNLNNFYNFKGYVNDYGDAIPNFNFAHIGLTLKCEPLDNTGRDVLMYNTGEDIWIDQMADNGTWLPSANIKPSSGYHLNLQGNEVFTVADLNPDAAKLNFNKEVIILQSNISPKDQLNARYNGKVSMAIASIESISANRNIKFKSTGPALPFSSGDNFEVSGFVAGDFDLNDADVYNVGTPTILRVEDFKQPLVILNSPPVHFDVLGGTVFNLCDNYKNPPLPFSVIYKTTNEGQATTNVKVDKGIGLSSELNIYALAGGSGFDAGVKANFAKDNSFYKSEVSDISLANENTYSNEDFILYSSIDYDYYNYPVTDRKGKKLGDIAVLNPVKFKETKWKSANDWDDPSYVLNHEPGNLLSYKQTENWADTSLLPPDFRLKILANKPITSSSLANVSYKRSNIGINENTSSYSAGFGADLLLKAGLETSITAELAPLGIGASVGTEVKIGVSCKLSANYSTSNLSTHRTELTESFEIVINTGNLVQAYDATARYNISPYIYRSQNGALVLDYKVNIDESNKDWWKGKYGANPDLAFILPWRYATEKGGEGVPISKKQKTNDIQFYPTIVSPGDTVVITARVHNFSLKTFNDPLKVNYYLGDPEQGGIMLTDIYGNTGSSKNSTMIYGATKVDEDREEYLNFIWKVPKTLNCSPRIYAVIDQENEHTEIHENNNVGWNMLNIYNCNKCEYVEIKTHTENIIAEQLFFNAYPNPFSSDCRIRFSLPQPEDVQIDLYDIAGHKISTVAKRQYDSGEHEVSLSGENLSNGIYICRINAGTYSEVIKLAMIK